MVTSSEIKRRSEFFAPFIMVGTRVCVAVWWLAGWRCLLPGPISPCPAP